MIIFLLFLLGLVFGSFVTAISYRIPRRISFTKGRSVCDSCKSVINWYDNIPLFSFIALGGRCRHCHNKISIRYPLTELATAIGFVLIGLNVPYLILFVILETIFIIDLEHQSIPDVLVFTGLLIAIVFKSFSFESLLSGLIASSLLLLIHLFTLGRGMGLGDVKFAVLGGLITGLRLMPIWLFSSFSVGAIIGLILIFLGKAGMKSKIAFGPFLIIGLGIAVIWGNDIIKLLFV